MLTLEAMQDHILLKAGLGKTILGLKLTIRQLRKGLPYFTHCNNTKFRYAIIVITIKRRATVFVYVDCFCNPCYAPLLSAKTPDFKGRRNY